MKILTAVASIFGIAFIGVFIWAISTSGKLNETQEILSSTEAELATVTAELEDTEDRLADTTNELTSTKRDLSDTRDELSDAKNELSDTKRELANTKNELSSTADQLTSTKSELASTQQELDITQETLSGLGITLFESNECTDVHLVDNSGAMNPTWAELKAFLAKDKTDKNTYVRNVYDCSQFSRDVHNNAEAAGIRSAEIQVWWSNSKTGHALNAFLTTDYGLVYVDCIGRDLGTRVKVGKVYRGVNIQSIKPANIRKDAWWDNLSSYYYISAGSGGETKTASIKIYW